MAAYSVVCSMVQIGEEKIPDLAPQDAIEIAEILVNQFDGEPPNEGAFARSIGHETANSGAFHSKLADLRKYGLLTSQGISATGLAYDLANPENKTQFYQDKFRMLHNIPLLSEFYDYVKGVDPPISTPQVLSEISGTNVNEAHEATSKVRDLYKQMSEAERKGRSGSIVERARENLKVRSEKLTPSAPDEKPPELAKFIPSESTTAIYIQVEDEELRLAERNEQNLRLAIQFLQSKLNETEPESSQTTLESE